jgi:hypothetical protein
MSRIEPILYRTIIIEDTKHLGNFCGIINHTNSTKSPDFFGRCVKAIAITNSRERDAAGLLSILKACHNIEILALWFSSDGSGRLSQSDRDNIRDLRDFITSPGLSPRWISIVSDIFPTDAVHFSCPIFQNATHVELVWEEPPVVRWDALQYLPCLTHLSIYCQFYLEGCDRWVRETVNRCPFSLRVFIIWLYSKSYFNGNPRSEEFAGVKAIQDGDIDSRAVVAYMGQFIPRGCDVRPITRSHSDGVKDCAGIPVGKDFWTLAEELIEERLSRRGTQVIPDEILCLADSLEEEMRPQGEQPV